MISWREANKFLCLKPFSESLLESLALKPLLGDEHRVAICPRLLQWWHILWVIPFEVEEAGLPSTCYFPLWYIPFIHCSQVLMPTVVGNEWAPALDDRRFRSLKPTLLRNAYGKCLTSSVNAFLLLYSCCVSFTASEKKPIASYFKIWNYMQEGGQETSKESSNLLERAGIVSPLN